MYASTPFCGAESRIELGPALQQADALPTEPCRTITEPCRTMLSNAAPCWAMSHHLSHAAPWCGIAGMAQHGGAWLSYGAAWLSMVWHGSVWCGMAQYGAAWLSMVRHGSANGAAWLSMVRHGSVWCYTEEFIVQTLEQILTANLLRLVDKWYGKHHSRPLSCST